MVSGKSSWQRWCQKLCLAESIEASQVNGKVKNNLGQARYPEVDRVDGFQEGRNTHPKSVGQG